MYRLEKQKDLLYGGVHWIVIDESGGVSARVAEAAEVWLWQERERLLASLARMTNAIRGLQQLQVGKADEADVMGSLASAADDLVAADQWLHERDAFISARAVQAYREQAEQPVDGTEPIRLDGRDGRDGA